MNLREELTEGDECCIAREIVRLLQQKGVSYIQAVRILKMSKKQIKKIPICNLQSGCKYTDRPDASIEKES